MEVSIKFLTLVLPLVYNFYLRTETNKLQAYTSNQCK